MRYILLVLSLFIVAVSESTDRRAPSAAQTRPPVPPVVIKDNPNPYDFGELYYDPEYSRNLTQVQDMANKNLNSGKAGMAAASFDRNNTRLIFYIPNINGEKNASQFTIDGAQAEKIVSTNGDKVRFLLVRNRYNGQTAEQKRFRKTLSGPTKLNLAISAPTDNPIDLAEFTEDTELNKFKDHAKLFCDMQENTGKVNNGQLILEDKGKVVIIKYPHLKKIKALCAEGSQAKPKYVRASEIGLLKMWQQELQSNPSDIRPHISFKIYPKGFLETVIKDMAKKNTRDYSINILTEEYETEVRKRGVTQKEKHTRNILQSFLKLRLPGSSLALALGATTKTEVRCELTDVLATKICILCDRADPNESLDVDVETIPTAKKSAEKYKMSLKYAQPNEATKDPGGLYVHNIIAAPSVPQTPAPATR